MYEQLMLINIRDLLCVVQVPARLLALDNHLAMQFECQFRGWD